jgi:hypothetical protein
MGPTALLPPEGVVVSIFIAFKNPSSSAAFEPETIASNRKRNNHYTTEVDKWILKKEREWKGLM